jgi:hypothetical protein
MRAALGSPLDSGLGARSKPEITQNIYTKAKDTYDDTEFTCAISLLYHSTSTYTSSELNYLIPI